MKNTNKKVISRFHRIYIISMTKDYHPPFNKLYNWINLTLGKKRKFELTIVLVSKTQIRKLNQKYRKINKPTDILSFTSLIPKFLQKKYVNLGELIISTEIVNKSAKIQNKKNHDHWAHIIIHGLLHLLGYNHNKLKERTTMEKKEITLLKKISINNPYI